MKNKLIPFILGIACVFAIAAGFNRQPFYAAGPTLVQAGSSVVTSDGTVTNAFASAYSAAPKVVVTQKGAALQSVTNIVVSVTTTNFIYRSSISGTTNDWIAVGTP